MLEGVVMSEYVYLSVNLYLTYTMRNIIANAILQLMFFVNVFAAEQDTIRIQTSALCEQCKKILEHDLSFHRGVKRSELDIESKEVMVIYNPEKTTPEKIRQAVTKAGYNADTLKADEKAFNRLPECCRAPDHH